MNNRSNITPPRKPSDTNGFGNYIKKGFTLAELVITIVALGMVAGLTIPTLLHNIRLQTHQRTT